MIRVLKHLLTSKRTRMWRLACNGIGTADHSPWIFIAWEIHRTAHCECYMLDDSTSCVRLWWASTAKKITGRNFWKLQNWWFSKRNIFARSNMHSWANSELSWRQKWAVFCPTISISHPLPSHILSNESVTQSLLVLTDTVNLFSTASILLLISYLLFQRSVI